MLNNDQNMFVIHSYTITSPLKTSSVTVQRVQLSISIYRAVPRLPWDVHSCQWSSLLMDSSHLLRIAVSTGTQNLIRDACYADSYYGSEIAQQRWWHGGSLHWWRPRGLPPNWIYVIGSNIKSTKVLRCLYLVVHPEFVMVVLRNSIGLIMQL